MEDQDRVLYEVRSVFRERIDTSKESGLVFRPLSPKLENKMYLIWKQYQVFSPIAERFLQHLTEYFAAL